MPVRRKPMTRTSRQKPNPISPWSAVSAAVDKEANISAVATEIV